MIISTFYSRRSQHHLVDQHCIAKSNELLTIGLSVHNDGASSVSVSISLFGKNIADSTNLGNTGSERRRAGGESTSGGNSCGGDEKELHGH